MSAVSCGQQRAGWAELNEAAAEAMRSGRSIEAEEHLLAALDLARTRQADASRLSLSLHRLARFYEARQRYSAAAEYYALALEEDSARMKTDDPELWDTVRRLAESYETLQRLGEAQDVYRSFLARQEAALGGDALSIASTLVQIGRLSRLRGAYEDSEEAFQRALSIRIGHLGQDNEQLPEILDEYVGLLRDTQQPYKADLMEERSAELRMKATARRFNEAQQQ